MKLKVIIYMYVFNAKRKTQSGVKEERDHIEIREGMRVQKAKRKGGRRG
jgi:hypothetical protein